MSAAAACGAACLADVRTEEERTSPEAEGVDDFGADGVILLTPAREGRSIFCGKVYERCERGQSWRGGVYQ